MKATTTYKRCAEIINLLSPMDIEGAKYVRVGRDFDGGYVMLEDFKRDNIEAAYSFGIKTDASWDEAIASFGIDVFMYDHTIRRAPKKYPRFHFFRLGVTGNKRGSKLKTLNELLSRNGHTQCKNLTTGSSFSSRR